LLLAVLLFPVDVAIRRLQIGRREWEQGRTWLSDRIPARFRPRQSRPAEQPASASVRAFRQVQTRTRQQPANPAASRKDTQPAPPPAREREQPAATEAADTDRPQEDSEDTLARLKAAKKRARRDSL
jgi:hypothetical protein